MGHVRHGRANGSSLQAGDIQFAEQPWNRNTISFRPMCFDILREANGMGRRLTKPNQPWSREDLKTVWVGAFSPGAAKSNA